MYSPEVVNVWRERIVKERRSDRQARSLPVLVNRWRERDEIRSRLTAAQVKPRLAATVSCGINPSRGDEILEWRQIREAEKQKRRQEDSKQAPWFPAGAKRKGAEDKALLASRSSYGAPRTSAPGHRLCFIHAREGFR